MESISKKTGKVFTGKLGELMARIGVAVPSDGSEMPQKQKKEAKKSQKKAGRKPKK